MAVFERVLMDQAARDIADLIEERCASEGWSGEWQAPVVLAQVVLEEVAQRLDATSPAFAMRQELAYLRKRLQQAPVHREAVERGDGWAEPCPVCGMFCEKLLRSDDDFGAREALVVDDGGLS